MTTRIYTLYPTISKPDDKYGRRHKRALAAWGKILIASGGILNLEKCFYYLIEYVWNKNGPWAYTEMNPTDTLNVPQLSEHSILIEHISVDVSKLTLGVWTNPLRDYSKHLMVIHNNIEVWTNRLTARKVPAIWTWVRYFNQLCPRVKYGLGFNASLVADLLVQDSKGQPLWKVYRKMLPYLGLNRNLKAGWRHLHPTFRGIGLLCLLTEVAIGKINLFLKHYNTPSTLGSKLTVSFQALQLELGKKIFPLITPFQPLGLLKTPCWMQSFCHCLDHYCFELEINYPTLQQPRDNDVLLSSAFGTCTSDEVTLHSLQ